VVLGLAAAWTLLLAAITLFPYQAWLSSSSYDLLVQEEMLRSSGVVTEMAAVVRVYGLALVISALVSALAAWRMTSEHHPLIVAWLIAGVSGCLLTRDVLGLLLFVVCLVLYLSRSRALRKACASHFPPDIGDR